MEYNIFLILLAILSLCEVLLLKNQKEIKFMLLLIASFIYWIFFGFRGFVSWDWFNYYPAFVTGNIPFELGYKTFMQIGRYIFDSYFIFIAFSTFLDISILGFFFYKYSPYPITSLCMFLTFGGMEMQFNLLRHIRVFLLFLLSISFIEEKNFKKYFLFNSIGTLFHRIGVTYLPLYFILNKNLLRYKKIILIIISISIIFVLLRINLVRIGLLYFKDISFYGIGDKVSHYLSNNTIHGSIQTSKIGHIEKVFTLILFWKYLSPIYQQYKYGKIFVNMYILFLLTYYSLYGFKILSDRLASFTFIASYWIIYPIIVNFNKGWKKYLLYSFLISFMFLKINMTYTLKNIELYIYKNVLFQEENLQKRREIYIKEKYTKTEEIKKYIQEYNKN